MNDLASLSDEEIVKKIISGDQELFSKIIEKYQSKLLRYANNLIKDNNKAVDIVQESFIKAFINLQSFDLKKKFSNWMYRIAHNETMNVFKKYKKEISLPEDFDFKSEENIEEEFDKRKIIEKINQYLLEIPLLYSEPLTLFYIEDKSYEEISDILHIPMGTVATRISRAKILMRKLCQKK
ncbi:MAG: sigma-70 family RNA polymerase sigma factor [Candidatus Zambryskibacteria bacterium]|nr:sigma-70 family RNA polymerase sigma factor [Candidatus Zambryskibacteria bacterium]